MRIVAHRGTRLNAPENSRIAVVSAFTAGADVIELDVQLTRDGRLVISHDGTIDRLTGQPGRILDMTLRELRHTEGRYDFSATFQPFGSRYYRPGRRLQIELLDDLLDILPPELEKLLELKHDSCPDDETRARFVRTAIETLELRGVIDTTVVYSKDAAALRLARQLIPTLRIAAFDWELDGPEQVALMREVGADGLVTSVETVVNEGGELTETGRLLQSAYGDGLALGAICYPDRRPGVFTAAEHAVLAEHDFVWSVSTDTMHSADVDGERVDVQALLGRQWTWVEESFDGEWVDRDRWSIGYAKAHTRPENNARIYQDDGIHIEAGEYSGWIPPKQPSGDPNIARIEDLELRMLYAETNWPYYTGGGVGLVTPIPGDFIAEVDYAVAKPLTQATTLEMAVVNVDPGAHRAMPPRTFRDKDSFYDPHGAPPFVGVEHDEDDGYRINWNLGTSYDNNQYGPPVGDGRKPTRGRLRLERRGTLFSAYYRNDAVPEWVCVGVARNESMNRMVYLRCSAKRWRQEKADSPSDYWPIVANTFTFRNLTVKRWR